MCKDSSLHCEATFQLGSFFSTICRYPTGCLLLNFFKLRYVDVNTIKLESYFGEVNALETQTQTEIFGVSRP